MQSDFGEGVRLIAGQVSRDEWPRAMTGIQVDDGRPQIVNLVFALTWAAADDVTWTINGTPVLTTAAAGEDTPEEVRDAHLEDLIANTTIAEYATFQAIGTDTIRLTTKIAEGTGRYFQVAQSVAFTTAGNGTAVATQSQARQDRGDLRFGMGLAYVDSDVTTDGQAEAGQSVAIPSASNFRFAGFSGFRHAVSNRRLLDDAGIPAHYPFDRIMGGYVAVRIDPDAAASIVPGGQVFVKYATDGNGRAGQVRHNNTNAAAVPATFTGRVQGTTLAEVYVNAP